MGADVAEAAAGAGAGGIGAPLGLLLPGLLERAGEPVLGIVDLHDADRAELPAPHHGAGLPHHGIARVGVGQGEQAIGAARVVGEGESLLQRRRQRLVADDVDAGVEKGVGGRGVEVVRRHDGDGLDPVGSRRFGLRHGGEVGVGARPDRAPAPPLTGPISPGWRRVPRRRPRSGRRTAPRSDGRRR